MYIAFCGMSFAGKQQYHDLAIEYMMEEKHITIDNMLIVSDPKSTDFGKAIVSLDRQKQHFNDTVSGMLYIAGSCNVYDNLISKAIEYKQHIFCKGCFTEVLGYQGAVLGHQGISWQMLKTIYENMLKTTHRIETIKYPDIIFFCINSFDKAKARILSFNSSSWEAGLSKEEYNIYSDKMQEAYNIIAKDQEFTQHTKILLIDGTEDTVCNVWNLKIKPEIDSMAS